MSARLCTGRIEYGGIARLVSVRGSDACSPGDCQITGVITTFRQHRPVDTESGRHDEVPGESRPATQRRRGPGGADER